MTTLKETLRADMVTSLKARDELKTTVLRSLVGAIQSAEKAGKVAVEFDDAKVIELLNREVKKRRETADIYAGKNVTDRAERELAEAEVIAAYLPQQLDCTEIETIVDEVIAELQTDNFGLIMKNVSARTKGRADGRLVSDIVRAALES